MKIKSSNNKTESKGESLFEPLWWSLKMGTKMQRGPGLHVSPEEGGAGLRFRLVTERDHGWDPYLVFAVHPSLNTMLVLGFRSSQDIKGRGELLPPGKVLRLVLWWHLHKDCARVVRWRLDVEK